MCTRRPLMFDMWNMLCVRISATSINYQGKHNHAQLSCNYQETDQNSWACRFKKNNFILFVLSLIRLAKVAIDSYWKLARYDGWNATLLTRTKNELHSFTCFVARVNDRCCKKARFTRESGEYSAGGGIRDIITPLVTRSPINPTIARRSGTNRQDGVRHDTKRNYLIEFTHEQYCRMHRAHAPYSYMLDGAVMHSQPARRASVRIKNL